MTKGSILTPPYDFVFYPFWGIVVPINKLKYTLTIRTLALNMRSNGRFDGACLQSENCQISYKHVWQHYSNFQMDKHAMGNVQLL